MNRLLIQQLKQYGVLTDSNRLSRKYLRILRNAPELMQVLLNATTFYVTSASPKERIHAVLQGISSQPVCEECGVHLNMRLTGKFIYTYATYCGSKCSSKQLKTKDKIRISRLLKRNIVSV